MELDKFDPKFTFLAADLLDLESHQADLIAALDYDSNPELKKLARLVKASFEKVARSVLKRVESGNQNPFRRLGQRISENQPDDEPQAVPSTSHFDVATIGSSHNRDLGLNLGVVETSPVDESHSDDDAMVDLFSISLDPNDLDGIVPVLGNLVRDYLSESSHREATTLSEATITSTPHSANKEDSLDLSFALNILASVYSFLGYYEEALNELTKVLEFRKANRGNDHLSVATVLNDLAVLHGKCENYEEAESLVLQSYDINTKREHDRRKYNFDILVYNFGALNQNQGKYSDAARCYQIIVDSNLHDPNKVYVRKSNYNLATCHRQCRRVP